MVGALASRSEAVLLNNYGRLPIAMVRGQGSFLFDENGKRYIDLFSGFGGGGIAGHAHPVIAEAVAKQAKTLLCHGNLFTSEPQIELAELLLRNSISGKVFFCHSGAEANETALKLVRKRQGERSTVISFNPSFHGRTFGALSLCPADFQAGLGQMLPGNRKVPYGDATALEAAIDDTVGAIFLEPVQGEGGVHVPGPDFIRSVHTICAERDILLIIDEVWTAPARTGAWFGYSHFGLQPDAITMAKALGGGAPVAACIIADSHMDVLSPGTHGCTLGGNPLCTQAALAACQLVDSEDLCERAIVIGERIRSRLQAASLPVVAEVRGLGAMLGLVIDATVDVKSVMRSALDAGLCIGTARGNVLRFAPALTIEDSVLDEGLDIFVSVLNHASN